MIESIVSECKGFLTSVVVDVRVRTAYLVVRVAGKKACTVVIGVFGDDILRRISADQNIALQWGM